jgi:UDP-N-acetylmuramoyl-tripeptide--D-alanyl-D-alanine ligase
MGLEAARAHARRLNVVEAPSGVLVLDDCYNANPGSMSAALATLQGLADGRRTFAVLGDMLELGAGEEQAHRALGRQAVEQGLAGVAFFGPRAESAFREAEQAGVAAAHFLEVPPLLAWLQGQLEDGDVVLVKGSRGMRLERVVEALTGAAAEGGH